MKRRTWAKIVLFVTGSVIVQTALLFLAFRFGLLFLFWPMAPGLYSMRWLPNDPASAGSFIVFPTLAQSLLALAVNTGVYAIIYAGFRFSRRAFNTKDTKAF